MCCAVLCCAMLWCPAVWHVRVLLCWPRCCTVELERGRRGAEQRAHAQEDVGDGGAVKGAVFRPARQQRPLVAEQQEADGRVELELRAAERACRGDGVEVACTDDSWAWLCEGSRGWQQAEAVGGESTVRIVTEIHGGQPPQRIITKQSESAP